MIVVVTVHMHHVLSLQHLHAEAAGLAAQLVRERSSIDPLGKARHVVQPLGRRRLTTQRRSLDDQRVNPLASSVQRSCQAGRSTTNDEEVVVAPLSDGLESQLGCQFRVGRLHGEPIGTVDCYVSVSTHIFLQLTIQQRPRSALPRRSYRPQSR